MPSLDSSQPAEQTPTVGILALSYAQRVGSVGLVFLIVIGGMLGWLAAIIASAGSATARVRNILIGIVGALIAGLVVNPLIRGHDLLAGQYTVEALLIALIGSATVLLAVYLWRDRELR
jgi:uncharacterized membrane protein YeaQ/YmgE (transglycosylase-associated protein family)